MAKTTRQDRDHLLHLKAGLDRGGLTRTWAEVGALQGITAAYARRVGVGKMANTPPVRFIDPREYMPELADRLSDEDVVLWNKDPRCLCGCGHPTLQEVGNMGKVPYGGFRLFRGAHQKRMPWIKIRIIDTEREARRRRRIGLARRQLNIKTDVIAGLIQEWQIAHPQYGYTELSRRAHLSPNHVRDIAVGRNPRMEKLTAGKILAALGEPMPPDVFTAYKAWAQSKRIPWSHIQVIK